MITLRCWVYNKPLINVSCYCYCFYSIIVFVRIKGTSLYYLLLHVKRPCLLSRADDAWKWEIVSYIVWKLLKVIQFLCHVDVTQ